ncbi:MAG: endolytic transglycosylase MltG [Clostridiales Family XIII bacterium]|nr:endolytic transglycosylase MltG [Clostridiales Family XIII bacterium]
MRNLLHNASDLIIALLIIAVAGIIIWWRVDAIIEYPARMAAIAQTSGESVEGVPKDDSEYVESKEDLGLVSFTIKNGESIGTIAKNLQDTGVIEDADAFVDEIERMNKDKEIQSGDYEIPKEAGDAEIIKLITTKP